MEENNQIISFRLPADLKLGHNAMRILHLRFEHPEYTHQQIGIEVGVSTQRVSQILSHPRVLQAFPMVAKQRVKSMLPKATKAYERLLTHENAIVSERASARILTDQKVFDTPESVVKHEVTLKSVSELRAIVEKASQLPENVIDAEVVPDTQTE